MAEITKIEWADSSWSGWIGCAKVSPGCKNCYAEREMTRRSLWSNTWGTAAAGALRRRTSAAYWTKPHSWNAKAIKENRRLRVFWSLSDPFEHFTGLTIDPRISPEAAYRPDSTRQGDTLGAWRESFFDITEKTPALDWLLLTKNPANLRYMLPDSWIKNGVPGNIWLGASVESDAYATRIPYLLDIPAAVRFVSYEPALEPVNLERYLGPNKINWLISGGESHPSAPRPADPAWFESVRDQSERAGIAYFHKQNGGSRKVKGSWGGSKIEGKEYKQFPEEANLHHG